MMAYVFVAVFVVTASMAALIVRNGLLEYSTVPSASSPYFSSTYLTGTCNYQPLLKTA